MEDYTKITQDPKIATQIIDRVLGSNGASPGVSIWVVNSISISINNGQTDAKQQKLDNRVQIANKGEKFGHRIGGSPEKYKHTTREDILKALVDSDWNASRASRTLELPYTTFLQRLRKHGGVRKLKEGKEDV